MALVAARLQFAIRVAARECSYVTDILRSEGGLRWREAVVRSCGVIRMLVPAKVASLPDPAVDILAWEASWRAAPGAWKLLVKVAVRVASKCPWKTADVLRSVGLNVQSVVLSEGPSDEFLCELCCKWWPSKGSLAQHRRRAHGDLGLAESARAVGPVPCVLLAGKISFRGFVSVGTLNGVPRCAGTCLPLVRYPALLSRRF